MVKTPNIIIIIIITIVIIIVLSLTLVPPCGHWLSPTATGFFFFTDYGIANSNGEDHEVPPAFIELLAVNL